MTILKQNSTAEYVSQYLFYFICPQCRTEFAEKYARCAYAYEYSSHVCYCPLCKQPCMSNTRFKEIMKVEEHDGKAN